MGKFDKNRLKYSQNNTGGLVSQATTGDLRLKLVKKNQILDARQVLNKKKQQTQQKKILTIKKQVTDEDDDSKNFGSLLIMKTLDKDVGSERRLYKVISHLIE